jgi:hypothetical protein
LNRSDPGSVQRLHFLISLENVSTSLFDLLAAEINRALVLHPSDSATLLTPFVGDDDYEPHQTDLVAHQLEVFIECLSSDSTCLFEFRRRCMQTRLQPLFSKPEKADPSHIAAWCSPNPNPTCCVIIGVEKKSMPISPLLRGKCSAAGEVSRFGTSNTLNAKRMQVQRKKGR